MITMLRVCITFGALLIPLSLHAVDAADHSWFGTWRLSRASSHFKGQTITIVHVAHGYHFDFGAVSFDVGDDGKDYPTVPTRTTSLKALSAHEWLRVHKANGREVDHSTITLTSNNKTMLIRTVVTDPNGHVHISEDREERIGKGTGLAGTWRNTAAGNNVATVIVLDDAGEGKIRWQFPQDGQFYVIAPNGVPVPYQGSRAVPGVTVALHGVSSSELRWTEFINGKPYTEGIDKLADNGVLMRETTWLVENSSDRQEAVYEKLRR